MPHFVTSPEGVNPAGQHDVQSNVQFASPFLFRNQMWDSNGYGVHINDHMWGSHNPYNIVHHYYGCGDLCLACNPSGSSAVDIADQRSFDLSYEHHIMDENGVCYCDGYLTVCRLHYDNTYDDEFDDDDNDENSVEDSVIIGDDIDSLDDDDDVPELLSPVTYTPILYSQVIGRECVICSTTGFEYVSLTCGHSFHKSCIERWIERTRTCPLCRSVPQMFSAFKSLQDIASVSTRANEVFDKVEEKIEVLSNHFEEFCGALKTAFTQLGKASTGFDLIVRLYSLSKFSDGFFDKAAVMWNVIMIIKGACSLALPVITEKFYDSMDSMAENQGIFESLLASTFITSMMPSGTAKILDFMSRHSRIRFLTDSCGLDSVINYIFSIPLLCIRFLEEHGCFPRIFKRFGDKYEKFLAFVPGSLQNRMQKRAVDLVVKYLRDPGCIRLSEYVVEFREVFQFYVESQFLEFSECERIPEGFKLTVQTLKSINAVLNGCQKNTRVVPVWIHAFGKSGSGKTTFLSQIVDAMSENYTVYPHQKVNQKEFFDGYNNEDIMWEEDITNADQLRKYLNLVTPHVVPLECCDPNMKGLKRFTSPFILSSSNFTVEELIEDGEHQHAIARRGFMLNFNNVNCDGVSYTSKIKDKLPTVNVFRFNASLEKHELVTSFDPNNGVEWFEKFAFAELEKNAQVTQVQKHRLIPIKKYALPQSFQALLTACKSAYDNVSNLFVEYSPSKIYQSFKDWFSNCDECRCTMYYDVKLECSHHICHSCLLKKNTLLECGFCQRAISETYLEKISKQFHHILDIDYVGSWHQAKSIIKETLTSKEFYKFLGLSTISALIGVSIAIASEYVLPKKEVVVRFVPPKEAGNVRKVSLNTNTPIYATVQGVYPERTSEEFLPQFEVVRKNMLFCSFQDDTGVSSGIGVMLDGLHLFCPAHFLLRNGEISRVVRVFGNDQEGAQLLSGKEMVVGYVDVKTDVAVLLFKNPTPPMFKSICKRFDTSKCKNKDMYLITPTQCLPVPYPSQSQLSVPYFTYASTDVHYPIGSFEYDYQADGLCGALLCDLDGYVIAFHVAYNPFINKGIARPFRREAKNYIMKCNCDGMDRKLSPVSAYVVESGIYRHVPSESEIVNSDVYGVFPVTRAPAVLKGKNQDGDSIIKKSVVKNVGPVKIVNEKALSFAKYALMRRLGSTVSAPLTEQEVVLGKQGLFPGFDKKSAAGIPFGCKNGVLLDYENGLLGPRVWEEIMKLRDDFQRGEFSPHLVVFGDTLKDELRDLEKIYKPRLFAAGPVHFAAELKRLFGDLVSRTQKARMRNGIMIGINPLGKEWDAFARKMTRLGFRIIPGDFKNWDGAMLAAFQEIAIEVLSSLTLEPQYAKWLLHHLINTSRVILDEMIVTTHSIPSGHFLTAFFNSIINEMYIAYSFYLLFGDFQSSFDAIFREYDRVLFSAKYGDDVFINVHEDASSYFTSFSFAKIMDDIGVGFTSESKKPHEKEFYLLEECTFLRRNFKYLNKLHRIVAPLNRDTLLSTVSYVTDRNRMEELVDMKAQNFQREAFFHDDYQQLKEIYSNKYNEVYGFDPPFLDDDELQNLFEKDLVEGMYAIPQSKFRLFSCVSVDDTEDRAGIDFIMFDSSGKEYHLLVKGCSYINDGKVIHGKWGIAKGSIKVGETPQQAAIREFKEECGYDVSVWDLQEEVHIKNCFIYKVRVPMTVALQHGFHFDKDEIAEATTAENPTSYSLNLISRLYFQL